MEEILMALIALGIDSFSLATGTRPLKRPVTIGRATCSFNRVHSASPSDFSPIDDRKHLWKMKVVFP
jgi:hypothetical protein